MNRMPRVYTGRDGLKGIGRIGTASCLDEVSKLKKRPSVYIGGGGVRMRTVLADGGIVGGGMKAVRGGEPSPRVVTKPKSEKRVEEFSKAKVAIEKKIIEAEAKAEKSGEAEVCKSKMEMARELNLAESAAKVEEAAIESQANPPARVVQFEESKDGRGEGTRSEVGMTETEERLADFLGAAQGVLPEAGAGEVAEETREVFSGLPLGETKAGGGKKKRKRRGRRVAESTEVSEAERMAIQTDLEAASDAAASVE